MVQGPDDAFLERIMDSKRARTPETERWDRTLALFEEEYPELRTMTPAEKLEWLQENLRESERMLEEAEKAVKFTNAQLLVMVMFFNLYTLLMAHALLGCRNVETERRTPPPKVSQRHQKKTGRPLVSYRVLKVNAMGGGARSEGRGGHRDTALHIVRGVSPSTDDQRCTS